MTLLSIENVGKEFATRAEPLVVLKDISLTLESGQNLAIRGPSGTGKSTLLHIIGTLETPTHGTCLLDKTNPFEMDEPSLAHFRNQNIGFVFQDHHLLPQLSAIENVLVPTLAEGRPDAEAIERAESLMERVGLADRRGHRPAELSGGERERVAVARALIMQPKLILADEPTGNLDPRHARIVGELMIQLQQEENTILIVVTHSAELADMMQSGLFLRDGELSESA